MATHDTWVSKLDEVQALNVLDAILAALSSKYAFQLQLYTSSYVCIITQDQEIAQVAQLNPNVPRMFFESAKQLLASILSVGTTLEFSPIGRGYVSIDIRREFGSTYDEIRITCDLS